MDNLALKLIDSMAVEQEAFIIDTDEKAEWALSKISEERADAQRLVNVAETMVMKYKEQIERINQQLESKTSYLKSQLAQYFNTVEHKKTKTQETYKLPSGTLKLKYPSPEFKKDDTALLKFLKDNSMSEFIKVEEKPSWAELKKTIQVSDGKAITADGQIVEGITVEDRPPVFEIE